MRTVPRLTRYRARARARDLANALANYCELASAIDRARALANGLASDRDRANALAYDLANARALANDFARLGVSDTNTASELASYYASYRASYRALARALAIASYAASALGIDSAPVAQGQRGAGRVAPLAGRLLDAAAHLLPAGDRARYAEEFRSELAEIARVTGRRRPQLAYAARQVASAWRLRADLRAPRARKAAP